MSKYRLSLSETNYIDFSEKEFILLENAILDFGDNKKLQSKKIKVRLKDKSKKLMIIAPIDNFEIINEVEK